MQLYNLELEKGIKKHTMPEADKVVYWTWVNNTTLGIVTATSVYHWSVEGERHAVLPLGSRVPARRIARGMQ